MLEENSINSGAVNTIYKKKLFFRAPLTLVYGSTTYKVCNLDGVYYDYD